MQKNDLQIIKTNKNKNTAQKTKKMSNTGFTKNRSELRRPRRASKSCLNYAYQSDHHRLLLNICMGFMFYLQYLYSFTKLMSSAISISNDVFVV
jgi:hypothetical protein